MPFRLRVVIGFLFFAQLAAAQEVLIDADFECWDLYNSVVENGDGPDGLYPCSGCGVGLDYCWGYFGVDQDSTNLYLKGHRIFAFLSQSIDAETTYELSIDCLSPFEDDQFGMYFELINGPDQTVRLLLGTVVGFSGWNVIKSDDYQQVIASSQWQTYNFLIAGADLPVSYGHLWFSVGNHYEPAVGIDNIYLRAVDSVPVKHDAFGSVKLRYR